MKITLNGKEISTNSQNLSELRREHGFNDNSICIQNGFTVSEGMLRSGDKIHLLERGNIPNGQLLEELIYARNMPDVNNKLKKACVGIAGLGGLGSNIAISLARTGIGKLVLADFDQVDPTNLNRQQYRISHLGMYKTEAMKSQISEINPFTSVELHCIRVSEDNCTEIFKKCDIVCEAFDNADDKSMLVNTLLERLSKIKVVSASGLAGLGSCNDIITKKAGSRLIVCGDGISEAKDGIGLMAPRAAVCAGHQANAVLQLILNMI